MITNSRFYDKLQALEEARQKGILLCNQKGVQLADTTTLPKVVDQINNIVTKVTTVEITTTGNRVIETAELPNTSISLYDGDTLIETKNTGESGGVVAFTVTEDKEYTIKAVKDDTEIWTNTIITNGVGSYICKSGKALTNYTWEEIETISENGYAKYMFNLGDYKQTNFRGASSTSDSGKAYLVAFDNIDIDDAGNKAGTVFSFLKFSSGGRHWTDSNTNANGISWVGSLIRKDCLEAEDTQFIFDRSVTSSSSGTYFVYNTETNMFDEKTLPDDYVTNTKYYTRSTIETEGIYIASLKEQLGTVNPKQCVIKTWGGYGGSVTNSTTAQNDNTIIKTLDKIFLPCGANIFGDSNRAYNYYDKYDKEGTTFDYFKEYLENKFRWSDRWLRSPSQNYSYSYCHWNNNGYLNSYSASYSSSLPFCFCI